MSSGSLGGTLGTVAICVIIQAHVIAVLSVLFCAYRVYRVQGDCEEDESNGYLGQSILPGEKKTINFQGTKLFEDLNLQY